MEQVFRDQSASLFDRACRSIPGGVNSPVRAFRSVGGHPLFIKCAKGAHITDVDNRTYIDYVGSWGPMILGHNHPRVIDAVKKQADAGLSFGAPTAVEVAMAEKICALVPSIDSVRMTSSGTEAVMTAVRLARAATNRSIIVKFAGCYHGHMDALLTQAGSGALTLGLPDSPGIPESVTQHTLTVPFNDIAAVTQLFQQQGNKIAAVIVEPVAGNMNCILPQLGFLETLRALCTQYDALLIFDEVMSGFRVAVGGAQSLFQITPDLTTLGKIIGGGMPVGAVGGQREIMNLLAPEGPVYQAGTLSGNPVSMSAGLAVLDEITQPGFYQTLNDSTSFLVKGISDLAKHHRIPLLVQSCGGMFGIFFTDKTEVTNLEQSKQCDIKQFSYFFKAMLANGVYLAPSAYEAGFVSIAHSQSVIKDTLAAVQKSFC